MCWPDLANLLKLTARLELGRAIRAACPGWGYDRVAMSDLMRNAV